MHPILADQTETKTIIQSGFLCQSSVPSRRPDRPYSVTRKSRDVDNKSNSDDDHGRKTLISPESKKKDHPGSATKERTTAITDERKSQKAPPVAVIHW